MNKLLSGRRVLVIEDEMLLKPNVRVAVMKAAWPTAVNATEARDARRRQLSLNSNRDVAVDELPLVDPILRAIFDPIPIVAEETYSFVRGRKRQSHATCTTPPIAHDLKVYPAVYGFSIGPRESSTRVKASRA